MKAVKKFRKVTTLGALLLTATAVLSGCSAENFSSTTHRQTSPGSGEVDFAIIDNPMNPKVSKSCYVKHRVSDQLHNAYNLAKYIEGRTVSDPTLKIQPLVVMDNKRVDTEMNMEGGVLEDVQDIVSKMSSCHEMFLSPSVDLTGKSDGQDFVLKIRFKESDEEWGTLSIQDAEQKDDWEIAYDSTKPLYTKEIKRVLDDNGDMDSTSGKTITK